MDAPIRTIELDLPGPLDLPASLAPLGRWGDDGIDRWDGRRLLRLARVEGHAAVPYRAAPAGPPERPRLAVAAAVALATVDQVARHVRSTIVLPSSALTELARADGAIERLLRAYPGIVPVLVPDPLNALVRSISAQQINLRWAAEIRRRLALRFGDRHLLEGEAVYELDAAALASATETELRGLQLTTAKSRAVIACARAAIEGRLEDSELRSLDDDQLIERLTRLPGIGRWSAEWFLARTLGRPRVVAGDLGVRKAVGRLYGLQALPSEAEIRHLTAHWGEAASLAQVLALHDLAVREAGS